MADPTTPTPSRDSASLRVAVPFIAATRARAAAAERPPSSTLGETQTVSSTPETTGTQDPTLLATPDNSQKARAALSSSAGDSSSSYVLGAVTHSQTGGAMGHFTLTHDADACSAGPSDSQHFVRRSVDARVEDPFVENAGSSPTDPFCGDAMAMEVTPLRRRAQSTTALRVSEGAMVYTPRPDRLDQQISTANAQGVFPPEACVFVANLVDGRSDEQLTESVGRAFGQFGQCYVKIRRDRNQMPFAFAQFETVEQARTAVEGGRGMAIDGRRCRTEAARVNRSVYLSRCDGGKVTVEEARRVLTPFGALQQTFTISKSDMEIFNLPEGVWVKFAFFQDCRDAQIAFKNNAQYRVEDPPRADEIRAQLSGARQALLFGPYHTPPPMPQMQYLQQQTPPEGLQSRGRRNAFAYPDTSPRPARCFEAGTIWIANTPHDVTQEQLVDAFGKYGLILSVDVVSREHPRRGTSTTFAFVRFQSDESVVAAVNAEENPVIGGFHLRVERKFANPNSSSRRPSRFHQTPLGDLLAAQVGNRSQHFPIESPSMTMETSPPQGCGMGPLSLPHTPVPIRRPFFPEPHQIPTPQGVLHEIYRYAVGLGVSHELSLDMVLHLQRVTLGTSPMMINPMISDQESAFGLVFPTNPHLAQYSSMPMPLHMPYELADTSTANASPRQVMMTDNYIPAASPLRHLQVVGTNDAAHPHLPPRAPNFAPLEGPPVLERLSPLVVSSTGLVESRLVTTPPPHSGASELPTVAEGSFADVAQKGLTHSAGASSAIGGGDDDGQGTCIE